MQMMDREERKRLRAQLTRLRGSFQRNAARMSEEQAAKCLSETMATAEAIGAAVPAERRQFYSEIFEALCLTMKHL